MEDKTAPADPIESDAPSPAEQVRSLIGDVRALAEAELDYAKARLSYSGGVIRKAGFWALLAFFFMSGAVVALILGLLLIITAYWGPWIATLLVFTSFSIAAWGAALYARQTANNLRFSEADEHDRA